MLCSICASNSLRQIATIGGYREKTSYSVSECGACGTSSALPCEVDGKIYEAIYRNVKDVPGYCRYYSLAIEIAQVADPLQYIANVDEPYFAIIDAIKNHDMTAQDDRLEICEVGCGQGYFTFALRKAGFRATGVEHSREAVESARKRYGDFYFCGDLTQYIETLRERPQIIFACEVIEHLVDPIGFIAEALECLPSGGLLAITTPNKFHDRAQFPQPGIWDTELPPVHLWWFTKNSFVEMAKRVNSQVDFSDFTEFYRRNDRFLLGETAVKSPVLDEDYNLIQFAPRDRCAPIKNAVKGLLPDAITKGWRRHRASRRGNLRYRDDDTAATIGALFRKK